MRNLNAEERMTEFFLDCYTVVKGSKDQLLNKLFPVKHVGGIVEEMENLIKLGKIWFEEDPKSVGSKITIWAKDNLRSDFNVKPNLASHIGGEINIWFTNDGTEAGVLIPLAPFEEGRQNKVLWDKLDAGVVSRAFGAAVNNLLWKELMHKKIKDTKETDTMTEKENLQLHELVDELFKTCTSKFEKTVVKACGDDCDCSECRCDTDREEYDGYVYNGELDIDEKDADHLDRIVRDYTPILDADAVTIEAFISSDVDKKTCSVALDFTYEGCDFGDDVEEEDDDVEDDDAEEIVAEGTILPGAHKIKIMGMSKMNPDERKRFVNELVNALLATSGDAE